MKLYLLGIVCLLALAAIPRADNDVDHDDTESDLTVEEGLRDETIASKTDDEVVQREDEAIKLDGLSVAEMKDLKESAEKHNYQAEVNRMMKLIINSLYRNKEIFLRELISNASDALDKIRFMSLTDPNVLSETTDLKVLIKPDKENHALHIIDTGIGMTREDLVKNLGTIAKSGTSEFLAKMEEGDETAVSSDLIGQFGVGFYSSFLVADTVVVTSKHNDDEQYIWESDAGSFSVAKDPRGNTLGRGTQISLFMKEEAYDFLEEHTIKDLVKKYSQFINFPIHLWTSKTEKVEEPVEEEEPAEDAEKTAEEGETDDDVKVEDEDDEKPKVKMVDKTVYDWEAMNDNKPIWLRNPKDVPDEDYQAFYKSFSKGSDDSLAHVHFTAEGEVTFRSILFVPKTAPYDLYQDYGKKVDNIKMYVKRVFITDDFEEMMPKYLNFVKGVVDSDDLPLNVSRETLQQNKLLRVIKKKLVRKALDMLKKMTDEDYEKFYKEFATNIKLGVMEDHSNRNRLAKLLRWQSSNAEGGELTSLTSYLERMKEKQEHIYFMTGTSRKECEMSPFVEKLLKKGYEVLYLVDPIDEYTVQNLPEFEGKKFQNAAKENLNLQDSEKAKETMESLGKDYDTLLNWLKEKVLSDGLDKAILSTRLVESPSALVASQYGYSGNMERIMKSQAYAKSGGNFHEQKKIMELNPFHPIVKKLLSLYREDEESEEAKNLAHALYDTALLRSGYSLKDTTAFSARMDKLLRTSYSIGADEKVEIPEEFDQPDEEEPKEEEADEDAEEAAEEVEDEEPAEEAEPPKDEL